MQSAYRPMLALVFFGNETRPSAVGLDVRFWFGAMTSCWIVSSDPIADGRPIHTACIQVRLPVDPSWAQ